MPELPNQTANGELNWHTGGLRLTVFLSPPGAIEKQNWWSEVVGNEPDSRVSRPKAGELQERGPFKEGSLALSVRPERVDWQYLPVPPDEPALELADVGSFKAALEVFVPLILEWIEECPPINRMAFGATLFQPVKDREEGYLTLSRYMNFVKMDPKTSSDFSYQINRQRASKSGVPELLINRLSRWAVVTFGTLHVTVSPQNLNAMSKTMALASQLDLDINTAAEFSGNLPKERLKGIFEELVSLAKEIAEKGDIP